MYINLKKIPNYSFSFVNGNDLYEVELNSRNGNTYISYSINKVQMAYNIVCLNKVVINDLFLFYSNRKIDPYYDNFDDFLFKVFV